MSFITSLDIFADTELPTRMQSLRVGTLLPGDLLYVPACSLTVERSGGSNNIGARATVCLAKPRDYLLYKLYRTVFSAHLRSMFVL